MAAAELFSRRYAERAASLPPACRKVAAYLAANATTALASSAIELASATGTSDATVIRTMQALGFASLAELKRSLLRTVQQTDSLADDMRRTLDEVEGDAQRAVGSVLETLSDAVAALRTPQVEAAIARAVVVLHAARRIVVFGIGPSAGLATYVATLLARTGRRCRTLDVTGAMLADQLLDLLPGDALVVLAYGRAYPEVSAVFEEAARLGLPVVLVTDSLEEGLASQARVVLPAQRGRADRVALHGATVACLEALAVGLASAGRTEALATLERLRSLRDAARGTARRRPRASRRRAD